MLMVSDSQVNVQDLQTAELSSTPEPHVWLGLGKQIIFRLGTNRDFVSLINVVL